MAHDYMTSVADYKNLENSNGRKTRSIMSDFCGSFTEVDTREILKEGQFWKAFSTLIINISRLLAT